MTVTRVNLSDSKPFNGGVVSIDVIVRHGLTTLLRLATSSSIDLDLPNQFESIDLASFILRG